MLELAEREPKTVSVFRTKRPCEEAKARGLILETRTFESNAE